MTIMSIIEPALLMYRFEDWQAEKEHCLSRLATLTNHLQICDDYGIKVAVTNFLMGVITQAFPFGRQFSSIPSLVDLHQFIWQDLARLSEYVDQSPEDAAFGTAELSCSFIDEPTAADAWSELLGYCALRLTQDGRTRAVVASWPCTVPCEIGVSASVEVPMGNAKNASGGIRIPVVFDQETWARQLVLEEWWPDIARCVDLEIKANASLRSQIPTGRSPLRPSFTDRFQKSIEAKCVVENQKEALVKGLAKLLCGATDAGLRIEKIGGQTWRARIDDHWRIHYQPDGSSIVFEDYGPHRIDEVD